jgi:hypothetical protein
LIAGVADNDDQPCASNIFVGFGQKSEGYSFAFNFKEADFSGWCQKNVEILHYGRYQKPVT